MNGSEKPAKVRVYLVVRDGFRAYSYSGLQFARPTDEESGQPSAVPVRAFASQEKAAEYASQLDEELRATFPPPLFAGNEDDDDSPSFAAVLAAKLKALGLPAIKFSKQTYEHGRQFREWWAANAGNMTAEHKAALWEPFAKLTFHRVKATDLEG